MSRKSKSFLPRLRRWRRGARWARRKLARAPRAVRIAGVVAILLALVALTNLVYQVIRKPTELFFLRWQRARQGAGRDVAAIRAAVPRLFHQHDHARIAGRAGAGREFRQSGGAHLLALAIEPESVRDLPARLQRRRPLPDDRCGLRRGRAVLYPGECGHGYRLRVRQPHYPRDPEPCHRARVRVSGPQCRGGSRPRRPM